MSVKMLHTCIRVMDLEKSLKFYKEALGLVETRRKDFPIYVCSTCGKVYVSTALPSTGNIISFFCNHAFAQSKSGAISVTNAAAGFTSPDRNHSSFKNFSVGNK